MTHEPPSPGSDSPASLLPVGLRENLQSANPWWQGLPGPPLPRMYRWVYEPLKRSLLSGLTPATVLRGPRRVGKTVLLRQLIESLLRDNVSPQRILYISFDELPTLRSVPDPVLAIARWYEQQCAGSSFNELARRGEPAFLFLDEVQNLDFWAPQLKFLVDQHAVRVLVTGSSSLRIEAGRDSLAGRITTFDLGPLNLREIASLRFGVEEPAFWPDNGLRPLAQREFWIAAVAHANRAGDIRRRSFQAFSDRGAFPIAHQDSERPWQELASHLNETIVQRAIQHDLRMGARGQKRDERLLEEVFRLACRYAGQTPGRNAFEPQIQQALGSTVGWNRISNYLRFLDGTLLVRLIAPLELRLKKKKSPPKICLCDHALRASWLQEVVPLTPDDLTQQSHLTELAGHLEESTLGYFLTMIPHLDVAHFPRRGNEPEVDFVLTVGTERIPIEVKYQRRIDPQRDTVGLQAFLDKPVYNAPLGLLVTLEDNATVDDPRIVPISLSQLLWLR